MEKILIQDILPILVIMILGYICGKFSYFDDDQRQGLNKVVLNIALPAALFVSIVKATREMLFSDLTLTIISVVGVVGMFMLSYWLCRKLFHHSMQEAAVCALIAGSPTIGFLGFAVLDPIYGNSVDTNLVIAIVAIVVNAVTIPIGMYLINRGQAKDLEKAAQAVSNNTLAAEAAGAAASAPAVAAGTTAAVASTGKKEHGLRALMTEHEAKKAGNKDAELLVADGSKNGQAAKTSKHSNALVSALKQPVCWAPILAVVFVLVGIRVPESLDPCFDLIAKANSGLAVLAAGLALSTVKFSLDKEVLWNTFFRLILTPAVFLVVGILCGMASDPSKLGMLIMAVALPPAFSGIIISSRYNIYVREGASSVAVSTVGFAATVILWVWLVPVVAHMF